MKAWDTFLKDLENTFGKEVVSRWLRPLKVINFDVCNLYLEAENTFYISWFEEHIRKFAQEHFLNHNAQAIKIHFSTEKKRSSKPAEQLQFAPLEIVSDQVDTTMLFTNFIYEGPGGLIVKFLRETIPGAFNPIFLHGPSGMGKTHLLMAIANRLKKLGSSVFFVHAETFTEHVVKAIRSSQMQKFREIYRHQDVLIIDDVHYFARRAATQEELFHTFNTLHTAGKQIILSSHLPPSRLEDIEPRLISRFEWGIVLQLTPLKSEKMEIVLRNQARLHHFPLDHKIIDYLLVHFSSSSKSMMEALNALMLRHRESTPISLEQCERLLRDLLQKEERVQLTPEKILKSTSTYFGISLGDILGKSQAKEYVFPRKLAMYLCRKKLGLPYLTLGRIFNRDHSTVMANIKQIEKKSGTDEIEAALQEIEKNLLKPV